jgi:hypothetical protein
MMARDEVEQLFIRIGKPGVDRRRSTGHAMSGCAEQLQGREDMPSRRLEDKIRILCWRTLSAGGAELEAIFAELKSSLHEHSERLRPTMVKKLANRAQGRAERRMF